MGSDPSSELITVARRGRGIRIGQTEACAHCRGGIDPIGEPHGPRWAGELWEGAS